MRFFAPMRAVLPTMPRAVACLLDGTLVRRTWVTAVIGKWALSYADSAENEDE